MAEMGMVVASLRFRLVSADADHSSRAELICPPDREPLLGVAVAPVRCCGGPNAACAVLVGLWHNEPVADLHLAPWVKAWSVTARLPFVVGTEELVLAS
jgi:hypothetical protein